MKTFGSLTYLSVCLGVSITITACGGGSGSGTTTSTQPAAQPPVVSSISPTKVAAGAANTTLTVNGSNFSSTTVIQVGQTIEPTSFVSASQVTAQLPASQLAAGGNLPIIAVNGSLSSASGTPVSLEVDNPSPALTLLSPATAQVGVTPASIAASGTGFVPTTVIDVNGTARTTVFISATQVNFVPSAADLSATASLAVTAVNPAPGGGTSSPATLIVNNPTVGNLQLTPSTVATGGSSPLTVTIKGSTFVPASVVQVNGTARPSTFVDANTLTFVLSVSEQAAAAVFSVTVTNPAPGGGMSPVASLTVTGPTPTPVITGVNPGSFIAGSPATTITVNGTGLTQASVVRWNGTDLLTSAVNYGAITLFAQVPAPLLATAGTASVTVYSPTAAPSLSNPYTITITVPPAPTVTNLYPGAGPINTDTSVTLNGSNFTAASTVSFNGNNLNVTAQTFYSLTVTIPATSIPVPGIYPFIVTTPAPGGGVSTPLNFTAYAPIANNDMVYNPANGLIYASVPSSAGPPYGNSIVSIDPATGALGAPILVGSEPNKLAVSSDGKILWVGLDGASAVRQVNLTTGTAGLQFTLGNNLGIYANPQTAAALAALPGSPNSVVVSAGNTLAIFDNGVIRGTSGNGVISNSGASALWADGTRAEIYAAASYGYATFTYGPAGLTPLATATTGTYANYSAAEIQIANGRLYTDLGYVYDAESGALLGTFYSSGTAVAGGATVADTTLGTAFIFNTNQFTNNPSQIQIFDLATFNRSASAIPVNFATDPNIYTAPGPARLTRWGANGLAFRTNIGLFSLRSNLVKDLSSTNADLNVTMATAGSLTTGASTTFTATVKNNGPSTATGVALTAQWPSTGVVASITPSSGTCSLSSHISCDLGSIPNGSSVTVAIAVNQQSPGDSTVSAQVVASENDPNPADNQASVTAAITGSAYNAVPVLSSISPAAVLAGATDTVLTITGSGFSSASTVLLDGASLATSFQGATQLTATVPAAQLASLGWSAISVSNSAPGGGNSASLPLTVYNVLTLGVNHILYDPYSRNIMASIGSGSSSVAGNSIAAINPETGSISTPVNIGSQPTNMALTSDGQILYTVLLGSQSVARYNMLTQQPDFTYAVPQVASASGIQGLRGLATQPGTENTIALDLGSWAGDAIYDFDPVNKTAAIRGAATGPYTGSCIQFLDAGDMYSFDVDTSGATFNQFTVTAAGFTYYNYSQFKESTLLHFGCFKFSGGLAFANGGGIANPAPAPAVQVGVLSGPTSGGMFSTFYAFAPDAGIGQAFYLTQSGYGSMPTAISAYSLASFMPSQSLPVDFAATEGANSSATMVDLIRWGQDGLALLSSGGHIYLFKGGFVLPQLLQSSSAATLTSSSVSTVAHGSGNLLLTLTGSNFLPGVAVSWNGAYRTTTIVDPSHVTVAIPASDLTSTGTASLVATNPGASASSALAVTIN